MAKIVKVIYNSDTLDTTISVDGKPFDTSRINGKEIADWAYPFMIRKVRWDGFYDEMVEALGGEKEFNLIFDGSEEALAELKEAWEDAPVCVIEEGSNNPDVIIEYDSENLSTKITVNGQPFDTSRIDGKEIEDWVYPFIIRKVKWNGIFEELSAVIGSESFTIEFIGDEKWLDVLNEECPETVMIEHNANCISKNYNYEQKYVCISYSYKYGNRQSSDEDVLNLCCYSNDYLSSTPKYFEKWLKDKANKGDAICQYKLAECYWNDDIKNENKAYAFSLFEKSAKQGFALANNRLGLIYDKGEGRKTDIKKAKEYYQTAADAGLAVAMYNLGMVYSEENNTELAREWLEKALEAGFEDARERLNEIAPGRLKKN